MNTFSTSIEKPQNPYLLERVSNLVDVVAKNGLEFENMLKRKQINNPEYSFLFDGEGSSYYRYLLDIELGKITPESHQAETAVVHPPTGLYLLSYEDLTHFRTLLKKIDGSKNYITNARNWILEHEEQSSVCIALEIRTFILSSISFFQRLYTVFMMNDSIVYSFNKHSTKTLTTTTVTPDAIIEHIYISEALLPQFPIIFHCVYNTAPTTEEKNKVEMILNIWLSKKIIDTELYKSIRSIMLSSQPPILPGDPILIPNPNPNNNIKSSSSATIEESSSNQSALNVEIPMPDDFTPIPKVGQMADILIEYMNNEHMKYKPINHALPIPDISYDRDEIDKKEKEFYRRYEKMKEQDMKIN